jgi:hypothetical protein
LAGIFFFVFLCVSYEILWQGSFKFSSLFIKISLRLFFVPSKYIMILVGRVLFLFLFVYNTLWQGSTSSSSESADLADSSPLAIPAPIRDKVRCCNTKMGETKANVVF